MEGNREAVEAEVLREFPEAIQRLVSGKQYQTDEIGMSSSTVLLFDDMVLKIQDTPLELEKEYRFMKWLETSDLVPKPLCYEEKDGRYYLLMSRMPGEMACNERYMRQPDVLIRALADGLKALWRMDITGCPVENRLADQLEWAAENIRDGLVDVEDAEPDTFGEDGFQDPEELLEWLKAHQPKEELALTHGDYCLPNVFVENGKFRGLIDLGRMGVADKWRDIALCYRSLCHNSEGCYGGPVYDNVKPEQLFEELGLQPDWEKIRYYILLDELF